MAHCTPGKYAISESVKIKIYLEMDIPMVAGEALKYPSANKLPKQRCSARCSSVAAGTTERCRGGHCSHQVVLRYKRC